MEFHSNQQFEISKEIRCKDCGNLFQIPVQQKSGSCPNCGNINLSSAINDFVNKVSERASPLDPLEGFSVSPDGQKVNELLFQFQVEWQLWSEVVKHFSDPNYHSAYLTHLIQSREFSLGVKRYQEHRSVMSLATDTRWQAEISDLMLDRIQNLAEVRMELEDRSPSLAEWIQLLPLTTSPSVRVALVTLGMIGLWTLFRVF